jgi:two-component system response regulator HydG
MHMQPPHILVVDDERGILASLAKIFEREGYQVSVTDNGQEALSWLNQKPIDVVLADIMMPHMSGMDLLAALKTKAPAIEVIMMTAFGTIENAVECMRQGAYDFITKPLKRAIVVRSVQRALERRHLLHENKMLREAAKISQQAFVVGRSASMLAALKLIEQAAPSTTTLLLQGESGTGKELLARHIHRVSQRTGPFVAINCAALPEQLLESELFGHERGAFTGAHAKHEGRFERAHQGTLLLDEIGETSPAMQVRLLRVLQEGEIERVGGHKPIPVDVRVLAATHRNLEEDVKQGRFREDLYYRLNVIPIRVPPLRERHGDVALLAQHFLAEYCQKNKKTLRGFTEEVTQALNAYHWPGNVRELENVLERAVVLCSTDIVTLQDIPSTLVPNPGPVATYEGLLIPWETPLAEIERRVIQSTLQRTAGDKKKTAQILGIAARTVYRKLGPR